MKPIPGTIAMASSWPAWERQGLPLPHPVIVLAAWPNGNLGVAPITTKQDLCRAGVRLDRQALPGAYPPLFREPCWICLRDKDGDCVAVAEGVDDALVISRQRLVLNGQRIIVGDEWQALLARVREARRGRIP